ncbi:LytTR family DNA-binding domain-containing protein [Pedobacter sp. Du54]|uniref:LytR/AlgR family response regulator transcription factor n=1 Tax=Pedobacter anseongensis TaxID=3133439 RepID=UPI0030A0F8C4
MVLTCYVIDDQKHAIDTMSDYIRRTPHLLLAGSNTSPLLALEEISRNKPDLVFLDVEMPELSGVALAGMLPPETGVVFTTSHSKYAMAAFETNAMDFLLKPFSFEAFVRCVVKTRSKISWKKVVHYRTLQTHIFVNPGIKGTVVQLELAAITHLEAVDHSILIHHAGQRITTHMNISTVQEKLPSKTFVRVHRSFLVNITHIRVIEGKSIVLGTGVTLPLGNQFRDQLMSIIHN